MILIEFLDEESNKRGRSYLRNFPSGEIRGKNGEKFLMMEPYVLTDFDEQEIRYRVLSESEKENRLDEKGRSLYDSLSKSMRKMEDFFMAPCNHVTAMFSINYEDIGRVKELLRKYTKHEMKLDSEINDSIENEQRVVYAYVPREFKTNLVEEFATAGIAGFDKEHKIFFHDADRRD